MSERKLYQIFKDKIHKADPNCWTYKIPDWIGGGKRPFDFFLLIQGVAFALEFKSKGKPLTAYQSYQLMDFINAGGEALAYWEDKDMNEFIDTIMQKVKERKGK